MTAVVFQFQHINFFNYLTRDLLLSEKIAGSATFNLSGELAEQLTGPSFYPTETELNRFAVEASIMFKNYNASLLEMLMGADVSMNTPTAGAAVQLQQWKGDGLFDNSYVSSISVAASGAIKEGLYRIEKTAANMVKVSRLSGNSYVGTEETTVTLSSDSAIDTMLGFSLVTSASYDDTGVDVGDYGTFRILGHGSQHTESIIGAPASRVPKVKLEIMGREMSDGRLFSLYAPNAIFPGLNLNFGEEFAENEVGGKIIYDAEEQCIARINYFQR